MTKLNLMHVVSRLGLGGLETLTIEIGKKLDKDRFNMEVLSFHTPFREYVERIGEYGIPVHLLKKRHRLDLSFYPRIARLMKSRRIDVVHVHSGSALLGALFAKIAGIRNVIYTEHGVPVHDNLKDYLFDVGGALLTDTNVAVTPEIADFMARYPFIERDKVKVIINGIDTAMFRPADGRRQINDIKRRFGIPIKTRVIGTVGRLEAVKDYPMLLSAMSLLLGDEKRDVCLVFIGEGSQLDDLKQRAVSQGIADRVVFLGLQHHLENILPMLDIFALSSISEGTSIALLEAQACGIPAVVTDVGGNGSIIAHGQNGFLCPSKDPEKMAELFAAVLDDGKVSRSLKKNAVANVEARYKLETMVAQYQQLYNAI